MSGDRDAELLSEIEARVEALLIEFQPRLLASLRSLAAAQLAEAKADIERLHQKIDDLPVYELRNELLALRVKIGSDGGRG